MSTLAMAGKSLSSVTSTPEAGLGDLRSEGGKLWRYVYASNEIAPKRICVASAATNHTVTVSSVTAPAVKPYGVVVNSTLTTGTYGWVAVNGNVDLYSDGNTAIVAGSNVLPAADGSVTMATGATGTTNQAGAFAVALQATTTAGTFAARIFTL